MAGISQAEFGYQPVLEGPRSPFHPSLGLWRAGEDLPNPQFLQGPGELGGFRRGLRLSGIVLEHRVSIAVQRQWNAPALDQVLQQGEATSGVLADAKHGVDHGAGGIVHGQQQRKLGTPVLQPGMIAAVQLHQHPSLGHTLTAEPALWRAPTAGTADACLVQNAAHRGPAEVDALPFPEQFGEVSMVGALVALGGQLHHGGSLGGQSGVVGTAAPVAVGQRGGTTLAVGGQHPPGVAW